MDKVKLNNQMKANFYLLRLKYGLLTILKHKYSILLIPIWIISISSLWGNRYNILSFFEHDSISAFMVLLLLGLSILFIYLFSSPIYAIKCNKALYRIGLNNHVNETPIFLYRKRNTNNPKAFTLYFQSYGVPLDDWINKQSNIENTLNICIEHIQQGQNKTIIEIYAAKGDFSYPKSITYPQNIAKLDSDIIILGESPFGTVSISLDSQAHLLIGGSTGSGKTVLLKFILMQCIVKDFVVYLADFKGGMDYGRFWRQKSCLIFDIDDLINTLNNLYDILDSRKKMFGEEGLSDEELQSRKLNKDVRRIVFACDELAELLDKTGLDSTQKAKIAQVESRLSTIARQGRAYGIHLVLVTQRPDANILPGQIKNNMDCRICGRADNVLSQIILDNTDASTKVPKNSQGLFLNEAGLLFKGFVFNERDLY